MKKHPINAEMCPIVPDDIETEKDRFWNTFSNYETEVSAMYVVRLCKKLGGWVPFTKAQIDEAAKEDFHFNQLLDYRFPEESWLVEDKEKGTFLVTHEFVCRVYQFNPVGRA